MMKVKVISKYQGKKAVIMMEYIDELKYPLMYVKKIDE
ncbi:MAG: dihydroneopterin aldolase family protein [Methanobacterium sp.]